MKRLAALFDDSTRLQILVDCKRGLETLLSNRFARSSRCWG